MVKFKCSKKNSATQAFHLSGKNNTMNGSILPAYLLFCLYKPHWDTSFVYTFISNVWNMLQQKVSIQVPTIKARIFNIFTHTFQLFITLLVLLGFVTSHCMQACREQYWKLWPSREITVTHYVRAHPIIKFP